MKDAPFTLETLALKWGLTADEYCRIEALLRRPPNATELGIFSVLWSEHCSYKSSRIHLRTLPTQGPRVIQGPGENAGVVDIGDGQAIVFKMESHNHPSFIEPYQGAATGVGGICRDIFTMGARPIALANALRFGRPDHPRTKMLLAGVVAGIGGYGNSFGVPTVAGDIDFADAYEGNILVNALCLGVVKTDRLFLGRAVGVGNPVVYVGAKTGRDGIHGATMASAEFGAATEEMRPTVQVGDPFLEKLLLEACLALMETDFLVGIQDMGAAGLACASVEMAARAGNGVELWLERVPVRAQGMTPYECMLSESQERMLLVIRQGTESDVLALFNKWDLDAAIVGVVTDTKRLVVKKEGQVCVDLPVEPLAEGITYERPMTRPTYLDQVHQVDLHDLLAPSDLQATLYSVIGAPGVASKELVYRQYDYRVRHNTVLLPGVSDAGVVRVGSPDGTRNKGIAITTDCNARFVYLDPYQGARLAVVEAASNVVAVGATPLAVTNCLNFGNPEKPEIMWQFAQSVKGMGDACRDLGIPIVSGNVSFYNETNGQAIFPTPMIGMVGLLEDVNRRITQHFHNAGTLIALIGENTAELGGSIYLSRTHGLVAGMPPVLRMERVQPTHVAMLVLAERGLLESVHDVSDGGLATCLVECCVSGPGIMGCDTQWDDALAPYELLFGEAPLRFVVSFADKNQDAIFAVMRQHAVPFRIVGRTGGHRLKMRGTNWDIDLPVKEVANVWREGLRRAMEARSSQVE